MFDAHRESFRSNATSRRACADEHPPAARGATKPIATRILVRDFSRSDRETLAIACLRLVLSAHEDADMSHLARAYELVEGRFGRRWAVDYVRIVLSIARALRREREFGFCFLRDMRDVLTPDEANLLHALQAAIDGNSVGVEAAALTLTQSSCGRAVAEDVWRLAKLALATEWIRRATVQSARAGKMDAGFSRNARSEPRDRSACPHSSDSARMRADLAAAAPDSPLDGV